MKSIGWKYRKTHVLFAGIIWALWASIGVGLAAEMGGTWRDDWDQGTIEITQSGNSFTAVLVKENRSHSWKSAKGTISDSAVELVFYTDKESKTRDGSDVLRAQLESGGNVLRFASGFTWTRVTPASVNQPSANVPQADSPGVAWTATNGGPIPRGRRHLYSNFTFGFQTDVERHVESFIGRGLVGDRWYMGEVIQDTFSGENGTLFTTVIEENGKKVPVMTKRFDLLTPSVDFEWKASKGSDIPAEAIGLLLTPPTGGNPRVVYPVQHNAGDRFSRAKVAGITWSGLGGLYYVGDIGYSSKPLQFVQTPESVSFLVKKP